MNEKQFGNLVVKVWRARQCFDAFTAKALKTKTVDVDKMISLASDLREAALKLAKV